MGDGDRRAARLTPHSVVRWAPAAFAAIACGTLLVVFGTPVKAVALYAAYWLITAVIPGTLLWRTLRIRPRSALEEIAAGTALGLAMQVLLTFVIGRVGAPPRLAILWCVVVVTACVVVPRMRRFWRSSAVERVSPWMAWALAAVSVVAVWWTANTGFRMNPLAKVPGFPGQFFVPNPYVDMPFHQALAAAALRGSEGFPFVPGVPLQYTLMAYEHLADFTRWTGVDLTLGLMRLLPVPLLVLAVVLCGVLAHRIAGSAVAGTLGGVLGYLTAPASLYRGVHGPFAAISSLNAAVYRSPTQTFGEPIFLALLLLIVVLLRERLVDRGAFAAVAVLMFVAGGAKATFLPLIFCGLVLVLVVGWILRMRKTWVCLALLALAAAAFVATLFLVVGTNSRGLEISDGTDLLSRLPVSRVLGPIADRPIVRIAAISLVVVIWFFGVIGVLAAAAFRRRGLDVWLLSGIGLAGVGAAIIGRHPGLSQMYFLRSAWPVLGVLAAVGFTELGRRAGQRRRVWAAFGVSLLLGIVVALIIRGRTSSPTEFSGLRVSYVRLLAPYAFVTVAALVAGAAVVLVARLNGRCGRVRSVAVIPLGLVVAMGVIQGSAFSEVASSGLVPVMTPEIGEGVTWGTNIPKDGAEAARWLRAHSGSSDVVVTNRHCLDPTQNRHSCDPRQFWLAALAERDVLIEGWSYSTPSPRVAPGFTDSGPFWSPALLAANDAAIYQPSPQTVAWLRSKSVKWVFVDRSVKPESPELRDYLDLVFERGDFAVYRVR